MATIEYAVVNWFDSRKEKCFGFLIKEDEEQVFFHLDNGRILKHGENQPEFVSDSEMKQHINLNALPVPESGDRIAFVRGQGAKGPKAKLWTYALWWDMMDSVVKDFPIYRIMVQYNVAGSGYDAPTKLWEGKDINSNGALKHYNPQYERPTFSCSDFDSRKWIESKVSEKGDWIEIADPRV